MAHSDNNRTSSALNRLRPVMEAINQILDTTSRDDALQAVVDHVCTVLGQQASAAITLTGPTGTLSTESYYVYGPLSSFLRANTPRAVGIGAWVVDHNQAIFEGNISAGETADHPAIRRGNNQIGAYSCLPLALNRRVYGTLFVAFPEAFDFSEDAVISLQSFAGLATRTIQLTDLIDINQQLHQTARQINRQISRSWQQSDPFQALDETLQAILSQVAQTVIPEQDISAAVYLYDEQSGFRNGSAIGPLSSYMKRNPPRSHGISHWVVEQKKAIFVNDSTALPSDIPALSQEAVTAGVRAFANLPLTLYEGDAESVVGVLIINLIKPYRFDQNKQEVLTFFADEAGIALTNARIHRRRLREQQAIQAISQSANSGITTRVWETIGREATEVTGAIYTRLFYVNQRKAQLEFIGLYNSSTTQLQTEELRLSLDQTSINGRVVLTQHEYYAPDVTVDPHFFRLDPDTQAAYCVPLIANDNVIGTLYIASAHKGGISEDNCRFIQQLAPYAAIALQNARLLETVNKVIHIQENLADVLTPQAQAAQIYEQLNAVVDVSGFFIATLDPYSSKLSFIRAYERTRQISELEMGLGKPYGPSRLGERKGMIEYVIQVGESLLVSDFDSWPNAKEIKPKYRKGVKSCLIVPMHRQNRVTGIIGLRGYEKNMFNQDDQRLLETLASMLAIVTENAQRYELSLAKINISNAEARQHVQELKAVSQFQQQISDLSTEEEEIEQIYECALETVSRAGMDTTNMFIALYDTQVDMIRFPLAYQNGIRITNEQKQPGGWAPRSFSKGNGLTEWVIRHKTARLIAHDFSQEIEQDPELGPVHFPVRSWLGAPMIFGSEVIGAIALLHFTEEEAYTEGHKELLQTIANQAAIALYNARIFSQYRYLLERREKELQAISQFQQKIIEAGQYEVTANTG